MSCNEVCKKETLQKEWVNKWMDGYEISPGLSGTSVGCGQPAEHKACRSQHEMWNRTWAQKLSVSKAQLPLATLCDICGPMVHLAPLDF